MYGELCDSHLCITYEQSILYYVRRLLTCFSIYVRRHPRCFSSFDINLGSFRRELERKRRNNSSEQKPFLLATSIWNSEEMLCRPRMEYWYGNVHKWPRNILGGGGVAKKWWCQSYNAEVMRWDISTLLKITVHLLSDYD